MARKDRETHVSATPAAGTGTSGPSQPMGLDYINWFGASWAYCLTEMGTEFSHFVAERIREDVRTQHAMLNSRETEALQAIQKAFIDKAIEDYATETGKLVEIGERALARETPEGDGRTR